MRAPWLSPFFSLMLLSPLYAAEPYQDPALIQRFSAGEMTHHLQAYAMLTPVQQAKIASEIDGVVQKIHYPLGEPFKQGDPLVSFKCKSIEIEVKRAKAALKAANAQRDSAEHLVKMDSISHVELTHAQSQQEVAVADLEKSQDLQSKCTVYAPYNGEIVTQSAHANETVQSGQSLIHIVNNEKLEVQAYIPSKWLQAISIGSRFSLQLQALPDTRPLTGKITKIVKKVDTASRSVLVIGTIDHPPSELFAGMSGVITFEGPQ